MPDWLIAILVGAGVPFFVAVWGILLSRENTVRMGWSLVDPLCRFLGQKLGKKGSEIIQGRLSTTLDDLTFGIRLCLRGDPRPTKEQLKARAKAAAGPLSPKSG